MDATAEFTLYPFEEGETPPQYVQAAVDELRRAGLSVEMGPLGQVVAGEVGAVLEGLRAAQEAAINAGATKVVVNLEVRT